MRIADVFDIMREIVSVSLRYYFLLFNALKVDKIVILSTIIFSDSNVLPRGVFSRWPANL